MISNSGPVLIFASSLRASRQLSRILSKFPSKSNEVWFKAQLATVINLGIPQCISRLALVHGHLALGTYQMSQSPIDKSTIDQVNRLLAQTGERERLKDMLRSKLVECGWTDRVQTECFSKELDGEF